MERANLLLFEPSNFMRLFIRKALESSPYTVLNEASSTAEALGLIDITNSRGTPFDLVVVSDQLEPRAEARGARHVIEHLSRVECPAKIVGIYTVKQFRMRRLRVTADISRDQIVSNSNNLRNLIAEI